MARGRRAWHDAGMRTDPGHDPDRVSPSELRWRRVAFFGRPLILLGILALLIHAWRSH